MGKVSRMKLRSSKQFFNYYVISMVYKYPKSIIAEYSVEPFGMPVLKRLFSGMKSGKLHVTLLKFRQWPKVTAANIGAVENTKMDFFPFLDVKA